MNRRTVWWPILSMAIALSLFARPAIAQSSATGAGAGVFPAGAVFNGVSLSAVRFGMGVSIDTNGIATGDFETTLLGTQAGQPRTITVVGKPTGGSVPTAGSASFSGLCRIDMGDGTPALTSVPFSATAVAGAGSGQTLTLSLGSTNLPAATGTDGRITVVK